jgi:hypothetical protein
MGSATAPFKPAESCVTTFLSLVKVGHFVELGAEKFDGKDQIWAYQGQLSANIKTLCLAETVVGWRTSFDAVESFFTVHSCAVEGAKFLDHLCSNSS